jgi:hypothetical protein
VRRRLEVLAPALVLLLLGGIELGRRQPLWYDELYTAQVARLSWADLWHLVRTGTGPTAYLPDVPPSFNAPYYAVMHPWTALFGDSPLALRLPSLLCAAAAASVVVLVVRTVAGRLAGVLAGLLVATGPLLVEQSVEARSYGMAVLATALAALGAARWSVGRPGLVLLGVAGAVAGLLHWFALPAVAGLVVGAFVARRSWQALLAGALAAVPTLVLVLLSRSHHGAGAPTPAAVGLRLPGFALNDWAVGVRPLVAVTVVLALVGAWRRSWLLLAWLVVPLVLITGAELARPLYYPRYLLPALLALAALAGVGLASVAARIGRAGPALVVAVLATALVGDVPRLTRLPREQPDAVVAQLAREQRPGEPVVAVDARAALDLDQYVARDAPRLRPDVVLPPDDAEPVGSRVWVVRFSSTFERGRPFFRFDDDDHLEAGGFTVTSQQTYRGITGDLTVQRWDR